MRVFNSLMQQPIKQRRWQERVRKVNRKGGRCQKPNVSPWGPKSESVYEFQLANLQKGKKSNQLKTSNYHLLAPQHFVV